MKLVPEQDGGCSPALVLLKVLASEVSNVHLSLKILANSLAHFGWKMAVARAIQRQESFHVIFRNGATSCQSVLLDVETVHKELLRNDLKALL